MADLHRIDVADRGLLLDALRSALNGEIAVQPVAHSDTPSPKELLPGTALVIHTSGSSGVPKFVAHSAASLQAGAEATNEILGGAGEWLIALPTHLIAGLQQLTRSVIGGIDPLFHEGAVTPETFREHALRLTAERRYTSLVPVQFAALMEAAADDAVLLGALQRFDAILVGGQAVSIALRQRAHELGLKLVRTYGMTETGGGVVYDGVEVGDTQMRIRGGEIQLAGPSLALGYLDNPELTDAQFITDHGTRWYRTGDAGSLLGGMLQVSGRLDRVIISGGVNVSLDRVEALIAEDLGWNAPTVAVAVESEQWGERVVLVAETGVESSGEEHQSHPEMQHLHTEFLGLQARIKEVLGPAAQPIRLDTCAELPRLANGKVNYRQVKAVVEEGEL